MDTLIEWRKKIISTDADVYFVKYTFDKIQQISWGKKNTQKIKNRRKLPLPNKGYI